VLTNHEAWVEVLTMCAIVGTWLAGRRRWWAAAVVAVAAVPLAACLPVTAGGSGGGSTPSVQATATAVPAPHNLLVGNQADFATSTGGWSATGGTVSWVSTPTDGSTGALAVTASGAAMSAWSATVSSDQLMACTGDVTPATPGTVYTGTAALQAETAGTGVQTMLLFCTGTAMGTLVWGPLTSVAATGWTSAQAVVGVAPAGTTGVVLGLVVADTSAGQRLVVGHAQVTGVVPPGPVVGPLSTSGNTIVDGTGHVITLRGVDLFGLEDSGSAPADTEQNVADIRSWGATMVRVSLGEQLWLDTSCAYDPTYAQTVAQLVHWITADGMVALLDLHFSNPADLYPTPAAAAQAAADGQCATAGQMPMADTGAITFWKQVATMFASNPLVAFDLYNEPYFVSQSVWLDGGSAIDPNSGGPSTYPVVGMQQLYDTVRSTGATNLVVVSGPDWANEVPTTPLSGTNIVYSVHAYTCPNGPPPTFGCTSDPTDPSGILDAWESFSATHPVMVGEFGWPDHYQSTYMANVIAQAERSGWSWDAFAWDGTPGSMWSLLQTGSTTGGPGDPYEPSPSGMPVLCAMATGGAVAAPSPCATATSSG
jgi:3D (Asp-Asp-Asp) domain-containing protein